MTTELDITYKGQQVTIVIECDRSAVDAYIIGAFNEDGDLPSEDLGKIQALFEGDIQAAAYEQAIESGDWSYSAK